jgi:trigger factor
MPATEVEDTKETYDYPVRIEDAGPSTKKVHVEIPRERIEAKLGLALETYKSQAQLPGFRAGHAPVALVRKRFEADIKEQVRREVISESYQQVIAKNELKVIGEPSFDNPDAVQKLPATGPMSYSVTLEIKPAFTLPNLEGLEIKRPKIEVTDSNVDQAMKNLREQQGQVVPVEEEAKPGDFVVGDFFLKVDGAVIGSNVGSQIVVKDGVVAGIAVEKLEEKLTGIKSGETRTLEADVPAEHPQAAIAGKHVSIDVKCNDIKRLEPAVIDADFLDSLGFKDEAELREALREQLVIRIDYDVAEAMRNQVRKYLLENTTVDLPSGMTQRQQDRVVYRRAIDLMQRGVPRQQIEANVEALRQGADMQAKNELKLFFIVEEIADARDVVVSEEELNGRVAMMAAIRGERPEKFKQAMSKDGSLSNLYMQLREQKALDTVIDQAKLTDVELNASDPLPGSEDKKEDGAV